MFCNTNCCLFEVLTYHNHSYPLLQSLISPSSTMKKSKDYKTVLPSPSKMCFMKGVQQTSWRVSLIRTDAAMLSIKRVLKRLGGTVFTRVLVLGFACPIKWTTKKVHQKLSVHTACFQNKFWKLCICPAISQHHFK